MQLTSQPAERPPADSPATLHARLRRNYEAEMDQLSSKGNRLSLVRLGTFLAAAALLITGFIQQSALEVGVGTVCLVAFGIAVVLHARTITAETRARIRRDIHTRHLSRMGSEWTHFASTGSDLIPRNHAYAWDIDIVGQGSLFQRIDVTHTHHGERALAAWLASPADLATIRARQAAVWELAAAVELRSEIEAAASTEKGERLDPRGLEALGRVDRLFERMPWLKVVVIALPLCTLVTYVAGLFGLVSNGLWLVPVTVQVLLLFTLGKTIQRTLNIVSARAPLLTAFESMLLLLERTHWQSPWLLELQKRVAFADQQPSAHVRRLARWAGFAELRQNALFYIFVNALTLWDLHVLHGLERFVREAGTRMTEWFEALGELEAIAALATLAHLDEGATRPEVGEDRPFEAIAIAHPLLTPDVRVANDVRLRGPGTGLVVTGSNMAGKSTLLRSVGQNIALALAGGPAIAEHIHVPSVRLRASMRADDSLESGASYFHAELTKLTRVIEHAEVGPPVFFLLDELLRGTNARARHVGAKAVLLHLLDRGAMGLCATHDIELAALGDSDPARIENVHFTDVVIEGEMRFDYKLRPGIVRTSNALRLLQMAGIQVPEQDRQDQQQAPPQPVREVGEGAR